MFNSRKTGTFCGMDGFTLTILVIVIIVIVAAIALGPALQQALAELSPLAKALGG